jgi:hypothetical protein
LATSAVMNVNPESSATYPQLTEAQSIDMAYVRLTSPVSR